ncbi:hypothetical protein DWF00_02630 [Bosea caraganae]|uniref:Uncharacterized protein n=1 Tax=Bosea caraganae TaxID=2763117 RepID=A0A370L2U6_9HYPH|nr:DUF4286 family protein [Bosea caraganae]RDJ22491.1 hypothetical protein DWE98_18795 [Bosea caraganae]RDJ30450.1 hypothetical protein DWF00_02630 [Bosea caraganae]
MSAHQSDWRGGGFLAIANTVEPAMRAQYEEWHTFEHVPERLTMPGFLGARRYVRGHGIGTHYLTLYDIKGPEALETPEYQHLLISPTPMSQRMRPVMGEFRRFAYQETGRAGHGCGRHLGFLRWSGESEAGTQLERLVGQAGIVALRLGLAVATKPHPAFAATAAPHEPHFVATIDGTDSAALTIAVGELAALLARDGFVLERAVYELIIAY